MASSPLELPREHAPAETGKSSRQSRLQSGAARTDSVEAEFTGAARTGLRPGRRLGFSARLWIVGFHSTPAGELHFNHWFRQRAPHRRFGTLEHRRRLVRC